MRNLVNYAVRYAKAGFSVLPMIGKKPMIKFADQPALTIDQIQSYWRSHPYAQLALRTTNFFVIDIDEHPGGADGFKSIADYPNPEYLRDTLSQTTAGGGRQLFYLKHDDCTIQQRIGWLPGVDIKAHVNNYVMVAPSERNGKLYQWENHNPIVTAPRELVQAINTTGDEVVDTFTNLNIDYSEKSGTATLFETIVNGLGATGGRNNALASFAGGLLFRGVDPRAVIQLGLLANANTDDSLTQREAKTTIESMIKKEIRRREANQ
ncbi:bifunctional DNA primase/polymerase [Lactiplantibacillus plantarum]|uniref:bifunctional DNA primase/polymerase n=1 Tax=Lactiplantibacillus plantarum TaxID=1590 RepID=UPI00226E0147|nr:bifunctional DNA primase/polymerase [Lactiplantibacillus plantarum]